MRIHTPAHARKRPKNGKLYIISYQIYEDFGCIIYKIIHKIQNKTIFRRFETLLYNKTIKYKQIQKYALKTA